MRIALAAASLAFAVACGSSTIGPTPQGALRLSASITRAVVPAGETAVITFRLQNGGSDAVTLHFSDSCQLNPYIVNSAGTIVYPPGGGWVCATVLTDLTLQPGQAETRDLRVGGMSGIPISAMAPLAVGEYSAYARVPSNESKLQSDPVRFTIQ